MPVPHLEIRIAQRSKGISAVAGAAYDAHEGDIIIHKAAKKAFDELALKK